MGQEGAHSATMPVWVELVLGTNFFEAASFVGLLKGLRG